MGAAATVKGAGDQRVSSRATHFPSASRERECQPPVASRAHTCDPSLSAARMSPGSAAMGASRRRAPRRSSAPRRARAPAEDEEDIVSDEEHVAAAQLGASLPRAPHPGRRVHAAPNPNQRPEDENASDFTTRGGPSMCARNPVSSENSSTLPRASPVATRRVPSCTPSAARPCRFVDTESPSRSVSFQRFVPFQPMKWLPSTRTPSRAVSAAGRSSSTRHAPTPRSPTSSTVRPSVDASAVWIRPRRPVRDRAGRRARAPRRLIKCVRFGHAALFEVANDRPTIAPGPAVQTCPDERHRAPPHRITSRRRGAQNKKAPDFSGASLSAQGEIRTLTPRGATPSRWCVYQFHHLGIAIRAAELTAQYQNI